MTGEQQRMLKPTAERAWGVMIWHAYRRDPFGKAGYWMVLPDEGCKALERLQTRLVDAGRDSTRCYLGRDRRTAFWRCEQLMQGCYNREDTPRSARLDPARVAPLSRF